MGVFEERLEQYNADKPYPGASVHDSSRVMTPEEIIKLKSELLENPERLVRLASFIVTGILTESYKDDAQRREEPACYASNVPQELEGRVAQASYLGANWTHNLLRSCLLPEDQWTEHTTSPASFAVWLEDMDAGGADHSRGLLTPIAVEAPAA